MSTSRPEPDPYLVGFDPASVPSPCFVVDLTAIERNLAVLREVADLSGAEMLVALKAFSLPAVFPLFRRYLDGCSASGLYEARLGRSEIAAAGESKPHSSSGAPRPFAVHTSGPAYRDEEIAELCAISDHLVFNSVGQWLRARHERESKAGGGRTAGGAPSFGLRLNPECPQGEVEIYDPCAPYSRLGTTAAELSAAVQRARSHGEEDALRGIDGLHVHALCEQDSYALERLIEALESRFSTLLDSPQIRWVNLGGGHHITRPDYDRGHLVSLVKSFAERHGVRVILEPGEATAIHTGALVTTVLDLHRNRSDLAILDTSATAHMPDVLEMPYRPDIRGAAVPDRHPHTYRLGGQTCLAGDVIGDYSFPEPLRIGQRLVFCDMSHYTMVKTTTFNGIPLPSIAVWDGQRATVVRTPSFEDFRSRLG